MEVAKMITSRTTYDELDEIMDMFRHKGVVAGSYMPTPEEVAKEIEPNFDKYADFVYWLLETSTPETDVDKDTKNWLMSLFCERVRIEEEELRFVVELDAETYARYQKFLEENIK